MRVSIVLLIGLSTILIACDIPNAQADVREIDGQLRESLGPRIRSFYRYQKCELVVGFEGTTTSLNDACRGACKIRSTSGRLLIDHLGAGFLQIGETTIACCCIKEQDAKYEAENNTPNDYRMTFKSAIRHEGPIDEVSGGKKEKSYVGKLDDNLENSRARIESFYRYRQCVRVVSFGTESQQVVEGGLYLGCQNSCNRYTTSNNVELVALEEAGYLDMSKGIRACCCVPGTQ